MVKFSIVVPVFNASKTIKRCLGSILKQSYANYEVILVNDGSTDDSKEIIDGLIVDKKNFKCIHKANEGVSEARNKGIAQASGDYLVFMDDDDTINEYLLEELNKEIERYDNLDLVRYQIQKIVNNEEICFSTEIFSNLSGEEAFLKLIHDDLFVTPVSYAYKKSFWQENHFKYEAGRIHEDFGLTPLVVVMARKVSAISYVGYNYIIRDNSIMTSNDVDKLKVKNRDVLFHYDFLMRKIDEVSVGETTREVFKSYISNALVSRAPILPDSLLKEYLKELKSRKVYSKMLGDTLSRKVKKLIFRFFPYFYVKCIMKDGGKNEKK